MEGGEREKMGNQGVDRVQRKGRRMRITVRMCCPNLHRFSPQAGSDVELSRAGYRFLTDLFNKYDKVQVLY